MNNILAIFFALIAAFTMALGVVIRYRTKNSSELVDKNWFIFTKTLTNLRWWLGIILSLLGYLFQSFALAFGSIILVQSLMVFFLLFALPLGEKLEHRRISKIEFFWAGMLCASIILFLLIGQPQAGNSEPSLTEWLLACVVIGGLVVFLLLGARFCGFAYRGVFLGAGAGIAYGWIAVLTKGIMNRLNLHGVVGLTNYWEVYVLLLTVLVATITQQLAFQFGSLQKSLPSLSVTEPVIAALLGVLLFKEYFKVNFLGNTMLIGLGILVVVSIVNLAHAEGRRV